jgi:adenine-specific DNA-methyltransferase
MDAWHHDRTTNQRQGGGVNPIHDADGVTLYHGDALEVLRSLPDRSVNLIATDPPYFRVKGEAWDNAWKNAGAFIDWLGTVADEWRRVLTENGTVYCFASPQMAARVQVMLADRFTVLNEVVWAKPSPHCAINRGPSNSGRVGKDSLRSFYPNTERIVVAEQVGADGSVLRASGYASACQELHAGVFEPLRQYLVGELKRSGVSKIAVNVACGFSASPGGMASRHYFSGSQWCLPTAEHYAAMRQLFNANGGDYLRREYDDLRREYDDLRREYDDLRREYDDLRRPFNVTADVPYTDVWTYPTVPPSKPGTRRHPCAKPVDMMRHIINTSSRPGDMVLDCFLGGGATAVAAHQLGRRFIGCDMDDGWITETLRRLGAERPLETPTLFDQEAA